MLKDYLNLIRVRQWYKNGLVFLALFFSTNLFSLEYLKIEILAFLSLSFISSINYIINDFIDLNKDKLHPEKKSRALASQKISLINAGILIIILSLIGFYLAYKIDLLFFYFSIIFLGLALLYTFVLKKIVFADVITISLLFVLRAVAGAIAINVLISPWLILCPFFLALFLSVGKRHGDLLFLKKRAEITREVLTDYNLNLTNSMMIISTTLLLISYTLYSFMSNHQNLIIALPFVIFVIFRYFFLIQAGSIITRHPEKLWKDKQILIAIFLWFVTTFILLYFPFLI